MPNLIVAAGMSTPASGAAGTNLSAADASCGARAVAIATSGAAIAARLRLHHERRTPCTTLLIAHSWLVGSNLPDPAGTPSHSSCQLPRHQTFSVDRTRRWPT